jgi:hypothetical protein
LIVAVTGASGLIGTAVVRELEDRGHSVLRLVRGRAEKGRSGTVAWDPDAGSIDTAGLSGTQGIVHLAGEPIRGRWTAAKRRRLLDSRVKGTALIATTAASLSPRPLALVCASAYGIYGDRGDEPLDEDSATGAGFLSEVARQWEAATRPAGDAGIRVVHARFGLVLSGRGGALSAMAPPWRFGLGAKLGSGRQWWPWVAIEDAAAAVVFALENPRLSGAVNFVAPEQVTNAQFSRALGRVLRRPVLFRAPAWTVAALFGESGREMLLASQKIAPRKLSEAGFEWKWPAVEAAMRHALGKR